MSDQATRSEAEGAGRKSAPSLVARVDVVVAAVILAICGFLFWDTTHFAEVPSSLAQNVQPTLFPRLLLALIAIMTLALPFEHIQKRRQGADLDSDRRSAVQPIVFTTSAVLIVVVALMPWIGTFLGLVAAATVLPLLWGERRWRILVPYMILFPAAVVAFFAGALGVRFVPGITGYLFQ